MQKMVIAVIVVIVLIAFLGFLSNSTIGNTFLSSNPAIAKFTACKSPLKSVELLNKEREKLGLEKVGQK